MEEEEVIVLAVCAAVAQVATLLAEDAEDTPPNAKTQVLTVTVLHFEPMLQSAMYESWFQGNLRCAKITFLRIASFLKTYGASLAQVKSRKHSFEKKVAAALYFLGSKGGYREVGAAMGMSRSYVKEITTEVVRILRQGATNIIRFSNTLEDWEAIEAGFAMQHGYPGVVAQSMDL
ncbi:unnamed protein product [Phytophthora lilii]|uniref:Unnamed protein product n=1 Tax=Phytophthora lilii TaxID=2077276 RepID=A0A9W7DD15_9STRA|nr:unnamed protein product [Phytophthora lilii]